MPVYSLYYNWNRWYPGSEEVMVLGQVAGNTESKVIHVSGWEELKNAGFPSSRLWLFNGRTAEQPVFALAAHGVWRDKRLRLGDEIILETASGQVAVPVAGVWHPFHPQLGDNWVVLVGDMDISATTGSSLESLTPVRKFPLLPDNYRGFNLVSWLLFNAIGFILFGALGLAEIKGRCAVIGWGVKLWVGGGIAVLTGLVTSAFVFRLYLPLPMLGLLPMTLGLLAASYFLALLLLSGLCIVISRFA